MSKTIQVAVERCHIKLFEKFHERITRFFTDRYGKCLVCKVKVLPF